MTPVEIEQVTKQVADQVAPGRAVEPRSRERLAARELTIEMQAEPYPEVEQAFAEFCQITGCDCKLLHYGVGRDEDTGEALVTATVKAEGRTSTVHGKGSDVVAAAVQAFSSVAETG